MRILTADWHLDDIPANEYRWRVLDRLCAHDLRKYDVCVAGDFVDRKDRHSAELVNRLIEALIRLTDSRRVVILRGNHDTPIRGKPYWNFLSHIKNLQYVAEPTLGPNGSMLLPHSMNPVSEWQKPDTKINTFIIHQTVRGAVLEHGIKAQSGILPGWVKGRVYSGDVHLPQQVGDVLYIGAPHPIKFGDKYECRTLLVNNDWSVADRIPIDTIRKHMIRVSTIRALRSTEDVQAGDQVKIEFGLDSNHVEQWPVDHEAIRKWAETKKVQLVSVEPVIKTTISHRTDSEVPTHDSDPFAVLDEFASAEGIVGASLETGRRFLRTVIQ
jgi:calcineurin-like phosphoesterase family protein